ncbi:MAG: PorV/PorQ family protein [Candidatus Marinimicrobia bacterium]|nr:PorV/PorQ family protein [Candidatus Neomarinimicrobiota bacterium]MCF7880239.1 PorV/PorQ family protein [Candidatus Neomarinimicrobiota bacterium]
MKHAIKILTVALLIAGLASPAHSDIKKVGQTGLQFLKIGTSARASAMGGAFTMVGNDANALFHNPAGIANMDESLDFTSGMTQWIADINYSSAAVVKNLGIFGAVGVSAVFADYGDIEGTMVANNTQGYTDEGNVDVGAYAVGVSYARALTAAFSIGGQVKYAYQHLGSNVVETGGESIKNEVSGLVYDFGTIFYTGFKSHRIGMSIRNFSPQFEYEETPFDLPLTFNIGTAMNIMDLVMPSHQNPLVLSIDAVHPRDYTERVHVGGEYWYNNMIALRAGYKFNYDEESLTAGFGFKQSLAGINVKIDYAYSAFDLFDSVNRFSFGLQF